MPQLVLERTMADVPPERVMELRNAMATALGNRLVNLMLDDPDYLTGATVRIEKDIEFRGASDTEMGTPFMILTAHIDARGNSYLLDKQPLKELNG